MLFKILQQCFPNLKYSWKVEVLFYWFIWLSGGIIYYSYYCQFGFMKGLYMAVNIGYSIGWNHPKTPSDIPTLLFSIGFELIGSSAVAYALQIFAECILLDDREWYVKELKREQNVTHLQSTNYLLKCQSWFKLHSENIIPICLCLFWLLGGALVAQLYIQNWNPYESVYFAFSSLATGGQQPIPADSPEHFFLVVGLYSAVGTPLMAYTLGCLASLLVKGPNIKVLEVITSKINLQDLHTMQKYGLENQDGTMDRAEYLILCMLRLGVVDPELVSAIVKRYESLDVSGDGVLSYKELLEDEPVTKGRGMKLMTTKKKSMSPRSTPQTPEFNEIGSELNISSQDEEGKKAARNSVRISTSEKSTTIIPRELSLDMDTMERGIDEIRRMKSTKNNTTNENNNNTNNNNENDSLSIRWSKKDQLTEDDINQTRMKGQQITARMLQLQRQREKEKFQYSSTGIFSNYSSPVRPAPLSPSLSKYMSPHLNHQQQQNYHQQNYHQQHHQQHNQTMSQSIPNPIPKPKLRSQSLSQSQSHSLNKSLTNRSFHHHSSTSSTSPFKTSSGRYPITPSLN